MKILLVDDEPFCRETLKKYILAEGIDADVKEARNGLEAIALIISFEPELVFLDIKMPRLSGFDVLCHFSDRDFKVVFQTAYEEYAVKAFEENAIDYLLKPISEERFRKCISRIIPEQKPSPIPVITEKLGKHGLQLEYLSVGAKSRNHAVHVNDVCYFKSENRMVRVYTKDSSYSCNFTLSSLEKRLKPEQYVRVHRNCLVNVEQVLDINIDKRKASLSMNNGEEVTVSRENIDLVKSLQIKPN